MATSTDPIVHESEPADPLGEPVSTMPRQQIRVSWGEDPYAEAELQRRAERTRTMIEKARRQLL